MEHLNKNQIVLLTLLVSFVTSIATGIMTTSLLQQAPVEVTRTINRVVEKTIEKVATADPTSNSSKEVTTVVVKEDDMVVSAINKNLKSIVRIKERDTIIDVTSFYGMGFVVSKDGTIATDKKTINPNNIYIAIFGDGTEFILAPIGMEKKTNFILFKANITDKSKSKYEFIPVTFASAEPKLGQTVVSLGGDISNAISVGRIISFITKESGTGTSTVKYISSIETDVSSKDLVTGGPLFDLSGNVMGIRTSESYLKYFTPITILKNEIPILQEK